MSRSQFCHHRSKLRALRPEATDEGRRLFSERAVAQAQAMGHFDDRLGSLANPHPMNVVSGDGTEIQAATDAMEGDLVVDSNGEAQQARYDPDAVLTRKDPSKAANPAFTFVHLQTSQPGTEQERVILSFDRSDEEGEARTLEALAAELKEMAPAFRCYGYDMAPQGASINRLYELGLVPAIKVPRNKNNKPASALIETRTITGSNGREHTIQIYGLDGVVGMKTIVGGKELFVPLVPHLLREPRTGTLNGFYEIPDHASVHHELRGRELMVRLDGLTDDGRHRPQYIRWINEHTEKGLAILGLREGTESEHSVIKRLLPWKRARSYSEFNNTLDLLGYFFHRNLKAALAHERRTGHNPTGVERPPDREQAQAA